MRFDRLHRLLALVLALALQAAPAIAAWHALVDHHPDTGISLSADEADCPLCEIARQSRDRDAGPDTPTPAVTASTVFPVLSPAAVVLPATSHDPHAPRAPPLS